MKKKKQTLVILCSIFFTVCTLFYVFIFFHIHMESEENQTELESEEMPKNKKTERKLEMINLRDLTTLEVVTDYTKFTPVKQDQSYHPETDMNWSYYYSGINFTDLGNTIYMSIPDGELLYFSKDTGNAGIACDKPECEHDVKTVQGDCQANLHLLNLDVYGLQYYKGDLYYTLGGTILYKMSLDREIKYKYASLLGEKGFGTNGWLIHRGYIYFCSLNEGIYKMPVDNPTCKELIISMPQGLSSNISMRAYGSYLYFTIDNSKENSYAAARYNIESNQIEQFMNVGESLRNTVLDDNIIFANSIIELGNIMVHDGKLYYTGGDKNIWESIIYQYDIMSEKNEVFLKKENKDTNFGLIYSDSDYIYIWKNILERKDFYDGGEDKSTFGYFAYTWDGKLAGEILNINERNYNMEPLSIVHCKSQRLVGSDNSRIYYLSMEWDQQTGADEESVYKIAGSTKAIISYINKAELSENIPPFEYIAAEIPVRDGAGRM